MSVPVDTALPIKGGADPAAAARTAEEAGYDAVWASELDRDPFLQLAVASAATERIGLGTGIAVAFARNPMNVASMAHDLQRLSQGRFMLGLGTQVRAHITRRFSMPWSNRLPGCASTFSPCGPSGPLGRPANASPSRAGSTRTR